MTDSPNKRRPRVGLVIGSGGIKCAAAMGLWRVLKREGIQIDMLVGCSGGSLYAGVMALGRDFDFVERMNIGWWTGTFDRLYYPALLRVVLPKVFGFGTRFGLVNDKRINEGIHEAMGDSTFGETQIPLYLVACDLATGEQVVINEGRVRDAVRASCAIPILLRPWPVNGRLLIDGGAVDPLPIDVAIREGCDIILAMGFETPNQPQIGSLLSMVGQATNIITNNLLRSTYAFYSMAHQGEVIPILPTFNRSIGLNEAHLIPYIEEQGALAAEEQIPYLKRLLAAGSSPPM